VDEGCSESHSILIDSSRDGGVWWSPQIAPFDPNSNHQGKALADYFKALGYSTNELPRPTTITLNLLRQYDIVIRFVQTEDYTENEISAYSNYVNEGGKLLLVSDHSAHLRNDSVAAIFGLSFAGSSRGDNLMNKFEQHSITDGVSSVFYNAGSGITEYPYYATIIGYLSDNTYLDLNNNKQHDINEPTGSPALGIMEFGQGKIVFVGDGNMWLTVPQPITVNTINYLLNDL